MTSKQGGHVDRPSLSAFRPSSTSKLQVQRSQSRDTITIHFSALGKEDDDEEEELYGASGAGGAGTSDSSTEEVASSQAIVTALEASEDLDLGGEPETKPINDVPVLPVKTSGLSSTSGQQNTNIQDHNSSTTASAFSGATRGAGPSSGSTESSPSKSVSLPSMDKAFLNLMKSLSTDVEPREGVPAPSSMRHRQIVKSLVKSLSTDTAQDPAGSSRPSDSRLSLHLFKQFTQPRTATTVGDSKTAPSSPLTSPENRPFSFKVSEVEARLEDTKRRFSEVISDPLQLISKFIGDEASNIYRPKPLSSSASESASLSALNGYPENNNNYSIKEEEGDLEGECTTPGATEQASAAESKTIKPSPSSLGLNVCSMSALAKQEDEEFCELYSEEFDFSMDTEVEVDHTDVDTKTGSSVCVPASQSVITSVEDEMDLEATPSIPHKTLFALTVLIYGYFILPLPTYLGGLLLGVALGFMLAIGVVWLTGPKRARIAPRHVRQQRALCNVEPLDIKEPGMFKGWMNEIYSYDPETYHATLTHSVFVRLDGSTLRISKPNKNITRRASYNEPKPDVIYISQKIYDLTDCKVSLVPPGLARKRIWNKKYPICIELAKQDDFMSKAEGERTSEDKENTDITVEPRKPSSVSLQDGGRAGSDREPPTIYLFGRTGREKEEWFHRILLASRLKAETPKKTASLPVSRSGECVFFFYCVLQLPYFMNELTLTELDMGASTPRILCASPPSVDHQGLWFDLEISYKGSFLMTLETKMNLSRLGKEGEGLGEFGKEGHRPRTYCLADSDEESSSAGSSDEDDGTENLADKNLPPGAEGYSGVHRPSKIMRFVDKITKNKYFQKAAETEFIKKKMEEVSNTPLLLTVELQECKGTLAVNIPPPPTDRIWYVYLNWFIPTSH
uniref:Testis expressed 2 n=1 Tax=Astyanax mexicanus TaxID=7994 RepID=A0A8B9JTV7_ASTMX